MRCSNEVIFSLLLYLYWHQKLNTNQFWLNFIKFINDSLIDKPLHLKGELMPEISLLHMKILTLIKAKSNVFLWYVQCCSCTRRSKTKILTTRAPPSWIEFDVVTSQCFRLCNATWIDYLRLLNDFSGFYKRSTNAGTWKSTITNHIQDVVFDGVTSQRQTQSKMAAP